MAYTHLLTKEQLEQEKRFNLEERDFHVDVYKRQL